MLLSVDDVVVDAVLDVRRAVRTRSRSVLVSFSVKSHGAAIGIEHTALRARGATAATPPAPTCFSDGPRHVATPATRCCGTRASAARERRRFGAAIVHGDLIEDVFGRFLGVFHEHVEVPVLVEDAGVEQFVLGFMATRVAIGRDDLVVRVGALRILVEVLHVRVRRRAVEIEVVLLHVLAVIPLAVGQTEQPLLKDRILAVPERQSEAKPLPVVAEARQSVFAPAVGARARLVVAEVVPRVAVRRCNPRARCPTAVR